MSSTSVACATSKFEIPFEESSKSGISFFETSLHSLFQFTLNLAGVCRVSRSTSPFAFCRSRKSLEKQDKIPDEFSSPSSPLSIAPAVSSRDRFAEFRRRSKAQASSLKGTEIAGVNFFHLPLKHLPTVSILTVWMKVLLQDSCSAQLSLILLSRQIVLLTPPLCPPLRISWLSQQIRLQSLCYRLPLLLPQASLRAFPDQPASHLPCQARQFPRIRTQLPDERLPTLPSDIVLFP